MNEIHFFIFETLVENCIKPNMIFVILVILVAMLQEIMSIGAAWQSEKTLDDEMPVEIQK